MAKTKTEVAGPQTNSKALEAYNYGQYAGLGFDGTTQDDYAVPFLNLLQANSPEVTDGDPKRIKDAAVGMFMDSVTKKLYSGEKGIYLVPCETQHCYVEWIPRDNGGGFVAVHALDSDVVQRAKAGKQKVGKLKMPEAEEGKVANDLVETFYVFCLILDDKESLTPSGYFVLAFTSSKIKRYKHIMNMLRSFSAKTPLFAHRIHCTSINDRNKKGQPFKNFQLLPMNGTVENSLIPPEEGDKILSTAYDFLLSVRGGDTKVAHGTQAVDETEPVDEVFG